MGWQATPLMSQSAPPQNRNDEFRNTTRFAALNVPNSEFDEIDRPKYGELSTPTGTPALLVFNTLPASTPKLNA